MGGVVMKAIEIQSNTDSRGNLKLDYPIPMPNKNVRLLILLEEDEELAKQEKIWIDSIAKNPAFDFLKDKSEDIYSCNDGEPLKDD
ncbi:hypothetical protein [Thermophagus xiamenensis]|nr:hypothetical protein [Thermophagus xiamenensis]